MKGTPWVSLAKAARFLDESQTGLRKKLDRAAIKNADGMIVATLPGLEGRKLSKLWKIRLGGWQ